MVVPERTPLAQGQFYAETAGVLTGAREHTHFAWRITEDGEDYWIEPWILFWQTFRVNDGPRLQIPMHARQRHQHVTGG